ncbi:glycoside hydrolase family 2 TIM barrel-domain containing protein [Galbibacter sp.]|uniref:glycoside hydrolase family 2 TIM barrel-domain containing protein n=1 Tax=Galbibacter sp. TaxID=2918471 RepID=UPI003A902726
MRLLPFILLLTLASCSTPPAMLSQDRTVYVAKTEQGFTIMRNSLPFKIKGAAGSARHIESLAEAGANTIRIYDTTNLKSVLDKALVNNLAVAVDIPLSNYQSMYYKSQSARDSAMMNIKNLVNAHKNHPALLFWMLGNEIQFPSNYFLDSSEKSFISFFNSLVNQIHELDPNHPVSTSIASIAKKRIFSLLRKSPDLDFISINIFGQIYQMESEIGKLSPYWDGPFLISEWGAEGPWANRKTLWDATIELNDTQKAEEIEKIYSRYLDVYCSRNLGDLVFYWGEKQESTHTWFSLLDSTGRRSNMAYSVSQYFQSPNTVLSKPPQIEKLVLNTKNSWANILLDPNSSCIARVEYQASDSLKIRWEIVAEGWNVIQDQNEKKPKSFALVGNSDHIKFQAPQQAGPYRLFVYLYDSHQNFTTANIPFYVLQ